MARSLLGNEFFSAISGLTHRCTRLATAGFARFRERVNSNVRLRVAPPPSITKAAVTTEVNAFIANIERARDLYRKIVIHGYSGQAAATSTKLNNPDSRDAAQFIYFEVAAKLEDFAKVMFQAEIRSRLGVTAARAVYVMGSPDTGIDNQLGWGDPKRLRERGFNLLGPTSFFGSFLASVGAQTYNYLIAAHVVRNRIAHSGGNAQVRFVKHLEGQGLSAAERQGMSVGRYLRDYPNGSTPTDRNFFRYLAAYEDFASKAGAALP